MKSNKFLKFIISITITILIGLLGSVATASSVKTWYLTINKPPFTPPNWLFGPVWTLLFILMGISFYIVWNKSYSTNTRFAFFAFFIQLVLNLLWSVFFFGLRNPWLAFFEIVFLWLLIIINIRLFYRLSKVSGYLLIPYLLWVSFASILNLSIAILN